MIQAKFGSYDSQELIALFKKEQQPFSWQRWYQDERHFANAIRGWSEWPLDLQRHYIFCWELKEEMKRLHAYLITGYVYVEGKCIECSAHMSVGSVDIVIPNLHGGQDTVTILDRHSEHEC